MFWANLDVVWFHRHRQSGLEMELKGPREDDLKVHIAQAVADGIFGQFRVLLNDALRCPTMWAYKEQVVFDNQLAMEFRHKINQ